LRFIGSKEGLLPILRDTFCKRLPNESLCVGDLFVGTAAVARLLKELGHKVTANDNLKLGYVFASAALTVSDEPTFRGLSNVLGSDYGRFFDPQPYDRILYFLNGLPGTNGFFYREYSPSGSASKGNIRAYFSDENARRIDAIRSVIGDWAANALITESERCLLLTDLIRAVNHVANIAGTYGCFIKNAWDRRALRPLKLTRSRITKGLSDHEILHGDANALARSRRFDAVYLDPPYTWRHYGAYYHIPETIAREDEPQVAGKTGLRPWEESRSPYCERLRAAPALLDLVSTVSAQHIFLSYSADGLIAHETILDTLCRRGEPTYDEIVYPRYRSNSGGDRRNTVLERLYYVEVVGKCETHNKRSSSVLAHAT
jgi:adenine-specific DNA-methyltransferase